MSDETKPPQTDDTTTIMQRTFGQVQQARINLNKTELSMAIAFMLMLTVCCMSLMKMTIDEPLYGLAYGAAGFVFGTTVGKANGKKEI